MTQFEALCKIFQDFCYSISLHGYSYLFIAKSIFAKVLWVFVITSFTIIGIAFIVNNTDEYLNSRLTTTETQSENLNVSIKFSMSINCQNRKRPK